MTLLPGLCSGTLSSCVINTITPLPLPLWLSSWVMLCGLENPNSAQGEWRMIASRSANAYPRGSYIGIPIVVSGVATPENRVSHWRAVIHKQESRHKVPKSVLRAVLGRMRFTLHATRRIPHDASRLVQKQCLPGG